jgi:hypothetical protein
VRPIFRVVCSRLSKRHQPSNLIVRTRRAGTSMDAVRAAAHARRRSSRDVRLDEQPDAYPLVERRRRGGAQAGESWGIGVSLIHNEPRGQRLCQPCPIPYDETSE